MRIISGKKHENLNLNSEILHTPQLGVRRDS